MVESKLLRYDGRYANLPLNENFFTARKTKNSKVTKYLKVHDSEEFEHESSKEKVVINGVRLDGSFKNLSFTCSTSSLSEKSNAPHTHDLSVPTLGVNTIRGSRK